MKTAKNPGYLPMFYDLSMNIEGFREVNILNFE